MSDFDFTTLITDRTKADVDAASSLLAKITAGTATEAELEQFNAAMMKGAYNYTDLNRVSAAVYYLDEVLRGYGYQTGVEKVAVSHDKTVELPAGYTQLKYIQSSGAQYIDTGFMPNQDTRVVMDIEVTGQTIASAGLFGVRDAEGVTTESKYIFWSMNTGASVRSDYFGTAATQNASATASVVGTRITIDKNKNSCTFSGTVLTNSAATGSCTKSLYLLCTNSSGTANYFTAGKLYSCRIYDNGTLARDYIPCINTAGENGLYDAKNGVFYGNAGTDTFTAGPVVGVSSGPLDDYTWYETDYRSESLIGQYLANVLAVYSTILTEPELPEKMADLTVESANQIEQALIDLDRIIGIMATTFIPCGEALCGGDNL